MLHSDDLQNAAPTPATPHPPFFEPADWLSLGLTVLFALVMYLGTLAPEVTLQFSGYISTSANYAGVSHPPGYPVWTIYSWFFVTLLPFYNIAWRVAVGSAVAASLACGLVALIVSSTGALLLANSPGYAGLKTQEQRLLRSVCGFVAGMALGLSKPVWRMAVVAETWALTVFFFALMICLLTRWIATPKRRRFLYAGFFAFGLLLTNNQDLIVMFPATMACVALGDKELGRDLSISVAIIAGVGWVVSRTGLFHSLALLLFVTLGSAGAIIFFQTRRLGSHCMECFVCAMFVLLGLAAYLYLPITSMTDPPANWGYPRTVEGFFHTITRGQYEPPHIVDQLTQFIVQLCLLVKQIWAGFGWPYLPLIPLPFCLLPLTIRVASKWLVGLAAAIVCAGPFQIVWLNPTQDRATIELVAPYFSPLFLVLAVCVGLGLMVLGTAILKLSMLRNQML